MTCPSTPTALPRFLYSTADMIHHAACISSIYPKRARMVVVLDPRVWVAERAPRTLSVADRRPGFWALHVCVCEGGRRNMHPNLHAGPACLCGARVTTAQGRRYEA